MANPNVAHPQSFPSLCKSVWTIREHIFCSRFPSRTPAPTFHASPLQFSPICSITWCLFAHCFIELWHYLSHGLCSTGYSWFTLPVTYGPCCGSILPMSLKNNAYVHTHVPSCHSDMTPVTELFRHTLYINRIVCHLLITDYINTYLFILCSITNFQKYKIKIENRDNLEIY